MCGVSDENTTAPPAATSAATAPRAARRSTRSRAGRRSGARGCRARCTPGTTHGQPFVARRVGERDPAREVLLGLDERVAVVLVPRETARLLGLLVHRLIPVQADVGPDQIGADPHDRRVPAERAQQIRPGDQMGAERDGAGLGYRHPSPLDLLERGVDLGLQAVGLGSDRAEQVRVQQPLDDHVAEGVEPGDVGLAEHPERSGPIRPGEPPVPRMRLHPDQDREPYLADNGHSWRRTPAARRAELTLSRRNRSQTPLPTTPRRRVAQSCRCRAETGSQTPLPTTPPPARRAELPLSRTNRLTNTTPNNTPADASRRVAVVAQKPAHKHHSQQHPRRHVRAELPLSRTNRLTNTTPNNTPAGRRRADSPLPRNSLPRDANAGARGSPPAVGRQRLRPRGPRLRAGPAHVSAGGDRRPGPARRSRARDAACSTSPPAPASSRGC